MTFREFRRLDRFGRQQAIDRAAAEVNHALNLFGGGAEPISDITGADSEEAIDRAAAHLLTPECHHRRGTCDHAFPAWFVREAEPAVRVLVRLAKYDLRA